MFSLNYQTKINGNVQAQIIYNRSSLNSRTNNRGIDLIYDSCLNDLNELQLPQLIIEKKDYHNQHPNPSILLPPLSQLTYITQLSIRHINITDNHIPAFPPKLTILNLYCTSIQVLDNLPHTLKFIVLSTNPRLTDIVLPPALLSFDVAYQGHLNTVTFPPTLTYLRFYQCSFKRLDRLSLDTIHACATPRPCFVHCIHPYNQVRINQQTIPYVPQPQMILDCIKSTNRSFDEDISTIYYRLRENSYSSTKLDCPIINAVRLASNPPRRFTEFIVE